MIHFTHIEIKKQDQNYHSKKFTIHIAQKKTIIRFDLVVRVKATRYSKVKSLNRYIKISE